MLRLLKVPNLAISCIALQSQRHCHRDHTQLFVHDDIVRTTPLMIAGGQLQSLETDGPNPPPPSSSSSSSVPTDGDGTAFTMHLRAPCKYKELCHREHTNSYHYPSITSNIAMLKNNDMTRLTPLVTPAMVRKLITKLQTNA